jgi:hypothetical protein
MGDLEDILYDWSISGVVFTLSKQANMKSFLIL